MGRKPRARGAAVDAELDSEVAKLVDDKRKAGDDAFENKKYGEALAAYAEALKALPARHSQVADLHASRAAVLLGDKKYKDAIRECNQGLAVEGTNVGVLEQRARARFESERYKDALSDIQKVNASQSKSDDTASLEAKIRERLSGKSGVNGGANGNGAVAEAPSAVSKASKPPAYTREQAAQALRQNGSNFVCKVTLDGETKYVHVPFGISYAQLQQAIKAKWTGLHNFKIFYHDKDGDSVLITCARDVSKAQSEILAYAQRVLSQRQRQGLDAQPPTCKLKLEKCKRGDVPAAPRDELPQGEEKNKVVVKSVDPHAEETVVELDEWLIDFANLFRDHLQIDPDKHVDMHTEGVEKCTRALDTVVQLPEAKELLSEALSRFRDVTCIGLCNWANVHLCLAKKLIEHAAAQGTPLADVRPDFDEHIASTVQRYKEALGYNEQYVEALLGLGQTYIEVARADAGIMMPALDDVDSEAMKELDQEELEDVTKAQGKDAISKLRAALKSITADDVRKSEKAWGTVYDYFKQAQEAARGEKGAKTAEREASRAALIVSPPNPDETHLLQNQVQIIWGNALYDQSQIWAGVGMDGWKAMVDDAKQRFLGASCKEADVNDALRNHIQADELDLPLEEKPQPPAPAPVPEKKTAEKGGGGAKGLPALKKKKGGGAAAAAAKAAQA